MTRLFTKIFGVCVAYGLVSGSAVAAPIVGNSLTLSKASPSISFDIDATGFENLTLTGSTYGHGSGSFDACDAQWGADCTVVSADSTVIIGELSGYHLTWTDFGPTPIPIADTSFSLIFDAHISGDTEYLTIEWLVSGDAMPEQSFVEPTNGASVPEPGSVALLGLGLAGMGFARRRKKA